MMNAIDSDKEELNNSKIKDSSLIDNPNSNNICIDNNDLDISHLFEIRGFLNLFTLNFDDDKNRLSTILLEKKLIWKKVIKV